MRTGLRKAVLPWCCFGILCIFFNLVPQYHYELCTATIPILLMWKPRNGLDNVLEVSKLESAEDRMQHRFVAKAQVLPHNLAHLLVHHLQPLFLSAD